MQAKLKQAIFCCLQRLVKLTPIFGLQWGQWHRQWGQRHRQSSSALGRVKLSVQQYVVLEACVSCFWVYVCFSPSVKADNLPSLQHACTFLCLFDQLEVLLPMVFLTVYYIIPHETEQACPAFLSLSLYCFFSSLLCTVPQIPTEFDHLIIPVVMAILICIVVAKLTNLQWIAYYNCSAYSPGARVSGAQSSCKWKLVFKVERKTVKTSNFVSLPFTVSLLLKNIFVIGMQVRHCVKQWSFPLETCIFPDKKPQKLFLVISNL